MAAKSILNELYQRLRTAAPVYRTQGHEASEGFVCALTLPAVKSEWEVLLIDRSFQGYGSSKKEAEHAAANAAVDFLRNADVLRPDPPSATHSSKATSGATVSVATTSAGGVAAAYAAAPSPCCSSATSAVTAPGVGSKRSKSNTDLDEDSTESLEWRILEALAGVYPRTLNGAQLAKLCGHFKLKSKVNHLLYMKLRPQGHVEMLEVHPPTWRAVPPAALATATPPALAVAAATAEPQRAAAGAVPQVDTAAQLGGEVQQTQQRQQQQQPVFRQQYQQQQQQQRLLLQSQLQQQQQQRVLEPGHGVSNSASYGRHRHERSCSYSWNSHTCSQSTVSQALSCGRSRSSAAKELCHCRSETDTDDEEVSPGVLAAAVEAAQLEPAPFAEMPTNSPTQQQDQQQRPSQDQLSGQQHTQKQQSTGVAAAAAVPLANDDRLAGGNASARANHHCAGTDGLLVPHLDLLAAMQLTEQLQPLGAATAATATERAVERAGEAPFSSKVRLHSKPQLEAGTKRKYPAYSYSSRGGSQGEAATAPALGQQAAACGHDEAADVTATVSAAVANWTVAPEIPHAVLLSAVGLPTAQQQHQRQQQQVPQNHGAGQRDEQQQDVSMQQPQRRRRRSGDSPSARVRPAATHLGHVSRDGVADIDSSDSGSCDPESEDMQQDVNKLEANVFRADAALPCSTAPGAGAVAAADLAAALLHLTAGSQQPQQVGVQTVAASVSIGAAAKQQPQTHWGQQQQQHQQGIQQQGREWPGWESHSLFALGLPPAAAAEADAACAALGGASGSSNPWQWQWHGQQAWGNQPKQQPQQQQQQKVSMQITNQGEMPKAVEQQQHKQQRIDQLWQSGGSQLFASLQLHGAQPLLQQQHQQLLEAMADSEGRDSCIDLPAGTAVAGSADKSTTALLAGQQCAPGVDVAPEPGALNGLQQTKQASSSGKALRQASPGPSVSISSAGASAVGGVCFGDRRTPAYRSSSPNTAATAASRTQVARAAGPGCVLQQQQQQRQCPQQTAGAGLVDLKQSEEHALQLLARLALPRSQRGAHAQATNTASPASGTLKAEVASAAIAAPCHGDGRAIAGRSSHRLVCQDDPLAVAVAAATAAARAAAAMAAAVSLVPGNAQAAGCVASSRADVSHGAHVATSRAAPGAGSDVQKAANAVPASCSMAGQSPEVITASCGVIIGRQLANQKHLAHAGCTAQQERQQHSWQLLHPSPQTGQSQVVTTAGIDAGVPFNAQGVSIDLHQEYERRVGTVKDLVNQLNEALRGLDSLREQVGDSGPIV